ncbi:MAG: NADPH-dependent reductase BacG [Myxococcota bacterium]|nr:NADPH-dependent reductase BacG [Myxococcota bacterium]
MLAGGMYDMFGMKALVCGASQGIGKAVALELARLGVSVILAARNAQVLEEVRKQLPLVKGQNHYTLPVDFNDHEKLLGKIQLIMEVEQTIHVLVNNTGGPPPGPVLTAKPDEFLGAFNQHLIANHLLALSLLPGMKTAGFGRIVNIVSTSVREPIPGLGVSNTIRAAVAGWAKTLAAEVAPFGITVNNVLPGYTRTGRLDQIVAARAQQRGVKPELVENDMLQDVPMGRFADPMEIATAVAFLVSPGASYITGASLPVDGGRIAAI